VPSTLPRYLTTSDAAELLSVTADKITDLIHAGQLAAIDVSLHRGGKARWRISVEDLEAFIRRRSSQPATVAARAKRSSGLKRKFY
jgi:excisionase family DNA binding protein